MLDDNLLHDWMVSYLGKMLTRDYDDVRINYGDDNKNEFNGHYPDLILGNHGFVLAIMEVETEKSVTPEKVEEWKALSGLGAKLIIMVPKAIKAKAFDYLWKAGIADKAAVGSYGININMP